MNANLKKLIETDEEIKKTKTYLVLEKSKDPTHYQRRKQQRAISEDMVKLCITYGDKKRVRGAITYTILDKSLINTLYYKFIDRLRGLRVVLNNLDNTTSDLGIHTVYWFNNIKKNPKQQRLNIK